MARTFSQIHLHLVFAVSSRENLIHARLAPDLYRYMAGILKTKGHTPLIINGMPDHVHTLFSLRPVDAPADVVRDLKNNSTRFAKQNGLAGFHWQEGYGIFSCSHSQLQATYGYIQQQAEHHRQKSFHEECLAFLQKHEIEHQAEHLFAWLDA